MVCCQVVQETSSKSYYRHLKHTIAAKLEASPNSPTTAGSSCLTHERLVNIVPLALSMPLANWSTDQVPPTTIVEPPSNADAVQEQDPIGVASALSLNDERTQPRYVRESSYDADVSARTSPLHPHDCCAEVFNVETPLAGRSDIGELLPVGDNACGELETQNAAINRSQNDVIIPVNNGISLAAMSAMLDVEVDINEHHRLLDYNSVEIFNYEFDGGCLEFADNECYYIGCIGPVRETIL